MRIFLGFDSFSIIFNHRSFQTPDPFSSLLFLLGLVRLFEKKDPWKEWRRTLGVFAGAIGRECETG